LLLSLLLLLGAMARLASLGHGHNKLPTTGAKCSIMLTSYSVKTTKKKKETNTTKIYKETQSKEGTQAKAN